MSVLHSAKFALGYANAVEKNQFVKSFGVFSLSGLFLSVQAEFHLFLYTAFTARTTFNNVLVQYISS